ncbi:MAG: glycosyltransferase family protein [Alphaproteobacteria bacterium]|jgi:Tfp pilus assembly protein PilF|nr:glycosyltransferase family protein [Alphaproteobacteria bacterium]MBT7942707.1 glycosyltransferase family protein [Alphaproteobacteria bacterium]
MNEDTLPPEQRLQQAVQLHQGGDLSEAEDIYREILEVDPGNATALHLLGLIAFQSGILDKALALISQAIKFNPHYPEALNNMGNVLSEMGRLNDALLCFQEAIGQKPDYAMAFNHLGKTHQQLGQVDEALTGFEKAIALEPEAAEYHFNLGILYLLMGQFGEGWQEYGWRRRVTEFNHPQRPYGQPVWDGGNPDGKTIFFYPEQGLGDLFQFVRYLPQVAAQGGRVVLETPTQTARLLQNFDAADVLISSGASLENFDCHASLLDLPGILGATLETIPAPEHYISPDPELTRDWAGRLGASRDFRIGLVWAGNAAHTNDANRSIDPGLLMPLMQIPGISMYSLQVGRDGEAKTVFGDAVTDLASELKDFADTAAVIGNLDLVVSVDTSVAHLAGAMGRPVWTLLPFMPDWRWLLDREDSPWYPSMRLFRQHTIGDWDGVIKRLSAAIIKQVAR